jgi:addiction module RelB/DinJ family antitoxin
MATVMIRTDDATKISFSELAKDIGLTTSSLLNSYMRDTIRKRRVSFDLEPTPFLQARMAKVDSDIKNDENITTYKNNEVMLNHLRS